MEEKEIKKDVVKEIKSKKPIFDAEEERVKIKAEILQELAKEEKTKKESEILENAKMVLEKQKIQSEETDKQIKDSGLQSENRELREALKSITDQLKKTEEEKQSEKVKNEIRGRVEKEPYLKTIVSSYLADGTIKTLEDYDKIINTGLGKILKEGYELKQKTEKLGIDPAGEFTGESRSNGNKNWMEDAKKKFGAEVNKSLGIR